MKNNQNNQLLMQMVVIGERHVGKSQIINRFINDSFTENYISNVGCEFFLKQIENHNRKFKLKIWDKAGGFGRSILENTSGLMFIYDVTCRKSFLRILYWISFYFENTQIYKTCFVLIGNKCDLESKREVSYKEGNELADSLGILFFETSAKSSYNINNMHQQLLNQVLQKI